jgi:hypothetical protein
MADPSATDTARGAALPARSWPPLPTSSEPTAEGREAQIDPTLDEDVKRLVERSTAAQGLPFHVQDPAILARVAALVNAVSRRRRTMCSATAPPILPARGGGDTAGRPGG